MENRNNPNYPSSKMRRAIIEKIRNGRIVCPGTCPIADKCHREKHNRWGSVTRQLRCANDIIAHLEHND